MDRVRRLRESHLNLTHTRYREVKPLTVLDDTAESEPIVIRKGKALTILLNETPAVIMDDELIIGLRTIYGALREGENVLGVFKEKSAVNVYVPYELPGNPATKHCLRYYPKYLSKEELQEAHKGGVTFEGYSIGHMPFGCQRVLTHGYQGIIQEASEKMKELEDCGKRSDEKTAFLRAVITVFEAASNFAIKHAHKSESLAESTGSQRRRRELLEIAKICRWISKNPPRTFHEALQLFWFTYLIHKMEGQFCLPIGRFDQDLYPYYKRDVEEGRLNKEKASELLQCLWIKLNFESDLLVDSCENITLSGQDCDGNDVTNELTYMCLDASLNLKLPDPKINVRFHEKTPTKLWEKCCTIVKSGIGGFPNFFNDIVNISGLMKTGVPIEDARLYSCDGCQEIIIPEKGDFYATLTGINFLESLLTTLYKVDSNNFKDLFEEYLTIISTSVQEAITIGNLKDSTMSKYTPVPFLSATLEGCIENAMDKTGGGTKYNYSGCLGRAFINSVNSLAVIKKLVYEDKLISIADLRDILTDNWEGHERLRQLVINKVPKYGNDDDYVDNIAVKVADHYIKEVLKYKNPRGGPFYPGIFTFSHVTQGGVIGASPDGRRHGEAIAPHLYPSVGTDLKGPTAVVNSALKICKLNPPEGTALGIKFHPSALQAEVGPENLMSFIKTFMDQGGNHIQFNIIDSDTLRRAQKNPENYRNLIVRVWGFSAYFTTLTKKYQDDIIARTEHSL